MMGHMLVKPMDQLDEDNPKIYGAVGSNTDSGVNMVRSEVILRAYPKTPPLLYVIQAQTKCNIAI